MRTVTSEQLNAYDLLNQLDDFAADNKADQNTLAKLTDGPGGTHSISVSKNDRIRGFFTPFAFGRDKDANNVTREVFSNALKTLFKAGSLSELPTEVRDVLKEDDFDGKGKPLSVRRISSVMNAVKASDAYMDAKEYKTFNAFVAKGLDVPADAIPGFTEYSNQEIVKFSQSVMESGEKGGGELKSVLVTIANREGVKRDSIVNGAVMMMKAIERSFRTGTDLVLVNPGNRSDVRTYKFSGNRLSALIEFVKDGKTLINDAFIAANQHLPEKEQKDILAKAFAEIDKAMDCIKVRVGACELLNKLPGKLSRGEKVRNFESYVLVSREASLRSVDTQLQDPNLMGKLEQQEITRLRMLCAERLGRYARENNSMPEQLDKNRAADYRCRLSDYLYKYHADTGIPFEDIDVAKVVEEFNAKINTFFNLFPDDKELSSILSKRFVDYYRDSVAEIRPDEDIKAFIENLHNQLETARKNGCSVEDVVIALSQPTKPPKADLYKTIIEPSKPLLKNALTASGFSNKPTIGNLFKALRSCAEPFMVIAKTVDENDPLMVNGSLELAFRTGVRALDKDTRGKIADLLKGDDGIRLRKLCYNINPMSGDACLQRISEVLVPVIFEFEGVQEDETVVDKVKGLITQDNIPDISGISPQEILDVLGNLEGI